MPLWTIHHTPGIFTAQDKHELAARIADHYQEIGLPRFYVITLFQEYQSEDFYVGGEPTPVGVRVVIDHIARRSTDREGRHRTAKWIKRMLAPYLMDKPGLHWEFHVDETSEDLWMINGIIPPLGGTDAEQEWALSNATSAY